VTVDILDRPDAAADGERREAAAGQKFEQRASAVAAVHVEVDDLVDLLDLVTPDLLQRIPGELLAAAYGAFIEEQHHNDAMRVHARRH
jgi:hypothetical protein